MMEKDVIPRSQMSIKLKIRPDLLHNDSYREATAEVKGTTVGECLNDLARQFPIVKKWLFDEKGQLYEHVNVMVNGEEIFPIILESLVSPGDEISIIVFIAGG